MKHKNLTIFIMLFLVLLIGVQGTIRAQFGTPTVDGTITAGEYGNHTNGANQGTSGGQVWYMTWDDTNLYVGLDVANAFEGAVLYLDINPITPINAGSNSDGNLGGQNYDNTSFAALPMRADFVTYFKNGYREYRTADSAGNWSGATSGFGSYADDSGDTRELAIPWSAITGGGRPASFAWFSYVTSGGGFVYGQIPTQNGSGTIGTSARYTAYYMVSNTANGSSTPPFSATGSIVFINELDADQTGTDNAEFIELYDGGVGSTPLDGLVAVFYNGSSDLSYLAFDLDSQTTTAQGYFVICGDAANVPNCNLDVTPNTDLIQNGQDAATLYFANSTDFPTNTPVTLTNLIDALVYDTADADDPGLLVLLNAGQPQIDENGGGSGTTHSNQRCPNGAGGLRNTNTYTQRTPTAGADNNCLPDLSVSKTGPTLTSPGGIITYTISYGNNGVDSATGVALTDTLPANTSYLADTSGLACTGCTVGATGDLVWTAGTVAIGASDSFELVVAVTNTVSYGSVLTNTVVIEGANGDNNTANNNDEWITTVTPLDLVVEKTGPAVAFAGDTIVYDLTLQNVGVATATNVILTDTLPLSVTYVADSAPWPTNIAGNIITWTVGDVPSDTLYTFNLTVTLDSNIANGTTLTNNLEGRTDTIGDNPDNNSVAWNTTVYNIVPIATVRAGTIGQVYGIEGQVIYVPGTFSANGWGVQDASGGIAVFYSTPPTVSLGDTVRLVATLGAFNNEEQLAAPVLYFQNLGAGPEVVPTPYPTGDVPTGSTEGWLSVISGTVSGLTCPTGFNYSFNLDDGSGAAIVFVDGDSGVDVCGNGLANGMQATAIGFSTQFASDYEIKPRRPSDVIFFQDAPDINKVAPGQVSPNSLYTYTITVENHLGYTMTNATITDVVPSNATFAYAANGGIFNGSEVLWSVGDLGDGGSVSVSFAVTATGQTAVIDNLTYYVAANSYPTPTFGTPVSTLVLDGPLSIHHIQGARHYSLFAGSVVTDIEGIVTAVSNTGFYMQDPTPDNDDATSEGIFVFTNSAPTVNVGDAVMVDGTVTEFYSGGSGAGGLSTTELTNVTIAVLSSGNPLPPTVFIGNGGRVPPNQIIDNDSSGDVNTTSFFDPGQDGIDFYESLEGMLVQVNDALVVGSNAFGEIMVVGDGGANGGILSPRGAIVIQEGDFNPERILIDDTLVANPPLVNVGDSFTDVITGVMDYSFGNFKLFNVNPLPAVASGGLTAETTSLAGTADSVTIGALNVENLDPGDGAAQFAALATEIVTHMGAPDILSLEEIQDNNGATNDGTVDASVTYNTLIAAIQDAGGPTYEYRDIAPVNNEDGGEPGGNIRVGFLFQPARVTFVDRAGGGSTITTTVGLGDTGVEISFSPGRINPNDPAFESSRKPLVGEFIFNGHKLFVIANHFNSKGGDNPLFGRTQPPVFASEVQRIQQATIVNDFVEAILALDPDANVVVLGDLNDFQFSAPIQALEDDDLVNLIETLPAEEQYTYVFDGNAQVLDQILATDNLFNVMDGFDVVHMNAEFPVDVRASDHDGPVAQFNLPGMQAGFISNSPVQLGDLAVFTNTTSGPGPISYEWAFGDGSPVVTDTHPAHTYAAAGVYTVTLTASNLDGSVTVTDTFEVTAVSPLVASFTSNTPVVLGSLSVFTNTSTGPGPISYEWDLGDGSPVVTATNPTHTYAVTGTYTVVLTATNGAETAVFTAAHTVTEEVQPPVTYTVYLPVVIKAAASAAPQPTPKTAVGFMALPLIGLGWLRYRKS